MKNTSRKELQKARVAVRAIKSLKKKAVVKRKVNAEEGRHDCTVVRPDHDEYRTRDGMVRDQSLNSMKMKEYRKRCTRMVRAAYS